MSNINQPALLPDVANTIKVINEIVNYPSAYSLCESTLALQDALTLLKHFSECEK